MNKAITKSIPKIVKIIGALLLSILLLVAGAVGVIAYQPQWILTSSNLGRAADWLRNRKIVDVHWQHLQIEVDRISWSRRRFRLHATEVCAQASHFKGCFSD